MYGTNTIKGIEAIDERGVVFLQSIGVDDTSILTKRQVDIILSLQKNIDFRDGSWYANHIPNSRFGNGDKVTSSKILLGKFTKQFFSSTK